MGAFDRRLSKEMCGKLKNSELFRRLLPDVQSGKVFAAPRQERVDFYHSGSKLFSYSQKGFRTNVAFAVTCLHDGEIYEENLRDIRPTPFVKGYETIKKRCRTFAGKEAAWVSQLWGKWSCLRSDNDIVVLDIEACFDAAAREDAAKRMDRLDLVLLHKPDATLLFVEVKLHSNPELVSRSQLPAIAAQIERYEEQLACSSVEILAAYRRHIEILNELFGRELPIPKEILRRVPLLIGGFDGEQKRRVDKTIVPALKKHERDMVCLSIGDAAGIGAGTLAKWYALAKTGNPKNCSLTRTRSEAAPWLPSVARESGV